MRKKFLVILGVALCVSLTACSDDDTHEPTQAETTTVAAEESSSVEGTEQETTLSEGSGMETLANIETVPEGTETKAADATGAADASSEAESESETVPVPEDHMETEAALDTDVAGKTYEVAGVEIPLDELGYVSTQDGLRIFSTEDMSNLAINVYDMEATDGVDAPEWTGSNIYYKLRGKIDGSMDDVESTDIADWEEALGSEAFEELNIQESDSCYAMKTHDWGFDEIRIIPKSNESATDHWTCYYIGIDPSDGIFVSLDTYYTVMNPIAEKWGIELPAFEDEFSGE